MKTASQLAYPSHYMTAYNMGKKDGENGKPYANPFDPHKDSSAIKNIIQEKWQGYEDGYRENFVYIQLVEFTD